MRKQCVLCKHIIEDPLLVACPKCKGPIEEISGAMFPLTPEHEKVLFRRFWLRAFKFAFKFLLPTAVIPLLLSGWAIFGVYQKAMSKLESLMVDRISREFEEEKISATVQDVAKNRALELLEKEVKPSVERIEMETSSSLSQIKERMAAVEKAMIASLEALKPPTLMLRQKSIAKTDGGFALKLTFAPSKTTPLGLVIMNAQLLGNSDARIMDFAPDRAMAFFSGDAPGMISPDKKHARLVFTPAGVGLVIVNLTVSSACTVRIQGNNGIETTDFDLR